MTAQTQPHTTGPDTLTDPAELLDWIAQDNRARLAAFISAVRDAPLDVLADAIRQACEGGFGSWMDPAPHATRPATHLYEISLFGVLGIGHDLPQAAASWRTAALRQTTTEGSDE